MKNLLRTGCCAPGTVSIVEAAKESTCQARRRHFIPRGSLA